MMRRAATTLFPVLTILLATAAISQAGLLTPLSDGVSIELPSLDPSVPAPDRVLGYSLGERFTPHHQVVRYLEKLSDESPRVTLWEYGTTYEGRPLLLVAVSSPENINRLEELRLRQLRLAQLESLAPQESEETLATAPVCVWLAYGVHGNEPSSTEAAMTAAYILAAAEGEWADSLTEAIVLIDPLSNPDGRGRYVHFFETRRGRAPDPYPEAAEHREAWPGGRQNHYLIDLNRDWAWATQQETRHRLEVYRQWEPHVYIDFHEMSAESTYFFPPAAEPVHPHINPRTLYWLEIFGRANAAAFDRQNWIYYVGEKFDLFYPGYGDTYPSLRGAIGMTYEVAGHGSAGQTLERKDGSTLTLGDRIARHLTTSLATVATAIENREALLRDFLEGRRAASTADPTTYLWDSQQQEARAAVDLLAAHGLQPAELASETTLRVRPLAGGASIERTFAPGTFAITTDQPLGSLVRSLVDLEASISVSFLEHQRQRVEQNRSAEFYDITAWSIPLAFNLTTWVMEGTLIETTPLGSARTTLRGNGELGFLVRPQGLASYRLVCSLMARGMRARLALAEFSQGSTRYPRGTLFLPRSGNPDNLAEVLETRAREFSVVVDRTATGYSESGISLGSDAMVPVRSARIGLVGGAGIDPTSFGFLWHFLDRDLEIPYHRLDVDSLDALDLGHFDVLVFPSGSGYGRRVDEKALEKIEQWLDNGGILVAIGGAVGWLGTEELTSIETWKPADNGKERPNQVNELGPAQRELYTPGAAISTVLDRAHPLTVSLDSAPPVLFRGKTILLPTGDPRRDVVLADPNHPVLAGFAWPEAEERLKNALLVGIERRGHGAVILFAQDPHFRLFWRSTAPLLINSILYAPSLNEQGKLLE
jgi:hypothetical protein